jgi:hypothetical protein
MTELATKWYTGLVDEIDVLYCETKYKMGVDLVYYYHRLGELIVKENGNFDRAKIYGLHILAGLQKSLEQRENPIKISISSLYRAKQFYTKNPDWDRFVSTWKTNKKGIVWTDVCKALPLPKEIKEPKEKNEVIETINYISRWLEKLLNKFGGKALEEIIEAIEVKIKFIKEEGGLIEKETK